jgi:uncharacterized membrane protein YgcG
MRTRLLTALALTLVAFCALAPRSGARADEGWVVRSFDAHVTVNADGTIRVDENIVADFGALPSHGIFRDLPLRYPYDSGHDRLTPISDVSVSDAGGQPVPFTSSRKGPYLRLKIGDPDVQVVGAQRYDIQYTVAGALNPFATHDELYWNVTGDQWGVPIERARATVGLPGPAIQQVACYQGPVGSTTNCNTAGDRTSASFTATDSLAPSSGLTVVLAIDKGSIAVASPQLVAAPKSKTVSDYFSTDAVSTAIATGLAVLAVFGLSRAWWLIGRDRWYGDTYYLIADPHPPERRKPLFAHETIVVQYTPPEVGDDKRRLRPAEVGLLVDERADTLDVSATIVDLAVRKFLLIKEVAEGGMIGIFKSQDYELERLDKQDTELRPYEHRLLSALFEDGTSVKLSDLKNKFHDDLADVKKGIYKEAVQQKFFPMNPESVRNLYRAVGVGVAVAGVAIGWLLGRVLGWGVIGIPIVLAGLGLLLLAHAMPRRTAFGWEVYRLCLGFRLYMVTAETDREKFAEEQNIFHDYLPYAIVFGCVKKWAETFAQLGLAPEAGYYVGTHPFAPVLFAESLRGFSTSLSGVMASTPGGSGGSGFSVGGGFSGGGIGGGGGGRW